MLPLLALIELLACVALLALFAHTLAARRTATLLRAAHRNRRSGAVPNSTLPNALLVIAHPDDEVRIRALQWCTRSVKLDFS